MKQEIKKLAKSLIKNAARFGYEIGNSHALHIVSSIAGLANFHAAKETPVVAPVASEPSWRNLADSFGGIWSDHPDHSVSDWCREVENKDTRLGYWEWVEAQIEQSDMLITGDDDDCPIILVTCQTYGGDKYKYQSEEDRNEGLMRLIRTVQGVGDGVERCYFFSTDAAAEGSETMVAHWSGDKWLTLPGGNCDFDFSDHDAFVCSKCGKVFDNDDSVSHAGDLVCTGCDAATVTSPESIFGSTFWVGNVGASLEFLGEGHNGDYDKNEPNDEPLMRLDFMEVRGDGEFNEIDGSGCTQINLDKATLEQRQAFLEMAVAYAIRHVANKNRSYKWLTGRLTWMDENWNGLLEQYEMPDEIPVILAKFGRSLPSA